MIDLILIRGLPSSGKSSIVRLFHHSYHFESDQFFMKKGPYITSPLEYQFDPELIEDAHQWCEEKVREQIKLCYLIDRKSQATIVVSNTFTQRWEMQPYIEMETPDQVKLTVLDLFDGGCDDETLFARNKHGVPLETFRTMRAGYEHDWKNGNPIPPWNRK